MSAADHDDSLAALGLRAAELGTEAFLAEAIRRRYAGRIAVVSSFGIDAAVLLHLVAAIDRAVPVVFIDTGKLFADTLSYRDTLVARLGLADVRSIAPNAVALRKRDLAGDLWRRDADACCELRKVEPLAEALEGFAAWISGRKRYHGADRETLPLVEIADGRLKINPLADWPAKRLRDYAARHRLPPHPLETQGYTSVGCTHCTTTTLPGEDPRAGRWRGTAKTECGIHRKAVTPVPRKRNRTGAIG